MQLTSEPVVTSGGVRQVLFRQSQFRPVLAFSIVGAILVGAATLLVDQPESAMVEVAVVALPAPSVSGPVRTHGFFNIYANPGEALLLVQDMLVNDLKKSMREAHTRAAAEARLHAGAVREWRWSIPQQSAERSSSQRTGRVHEWGFLPEVGAGESAADQEHA